MVQIFANILADTYEFFGQADEFIKKQKQKEKEKQKK